MRCTYHLIALCGTIPDFPLPWQRETKSPRGSPPGIFSQSFNQLKVLCLPAEQTVSTEIQWILCSQQEAKATHVAFPQCACPRSTINRGWWKYNTDFGQFDSCFITQVDGPDQFCYTSETEFYTSWIKLPQPLWWATFFGLFLAQDT